MKSLIELFDLGDEAEPETTIGVEPEIQQITVPVES